MLFADKDLDDIAFIEILERRVPQIRHHIGRKLESLYKAPRLQFVYDRTPERAQRVSDIINQISKERDSGPESKKQ